MSNTKRNVNSTKTVSSVPRNDKDATVQAGTLPQHTRNRINYILEHTALIGKNPTRFLWQTHAKNKTD